MRRYKDETYEAVVDYEQLTVGRFYTPNQRERLMDLLAQANWVLPADYAELKRLLFCSEMEEYDTKNDCESGMLFLSTYPDKDLKKFIISTRNTTFDTAPKYVGREGWLAYISRNTDYLSTVDKAVMRYVTGDAKAAIKLLLPYAKDNDTLSLKLVIALMLYLRMDKQVGAYIHRYAVVKEKLYFDKAPVKCLEKLKELQANGLYTAGEVKDVDYFDKSAPNRMKMGFGEEDLDD